MYLGGTWGLYRGTEEYLGGTTGENRVLGGTKGVLGWY